MENCPFIDDFPIKTAIYKGFSMAMLNNQMVDKKTERQDRSIDPLVGEKCICMHASIHTYIQTDSQAGRQAYKI